MARSLATAWPQPNRSLAAAWPLPRRRCLAAAWPLPGRSLPAAWPQPGRSLAAAWPQPGRSLAVAWPQGVLRKLDAQLGDRAAASAPPAHLLSLLPPILARQVTCVPSQQRDHRDILAAGQLWCVEDDGQNEGLVPHGASSWGSAEGPHPGSLMQRWKTHSASCEARQLVWPAADHQAQRRQRHGHPLPWARE